MAYEEIAEVVRDLIEEGGSKIEIQETLKEAQVFISTSDKGSLEHSLEKGSVAWGQSGEIKQPSKACGAKVALRTNCLRGVRLWRGKVVSLSESFLDCKAILGKELSILESQERTHLLVAPDSELLARKTWAPELSCKRVCLPRWVSGKVTRSLSRHNI